MSKLKDQSVEFGLKEWLFVLRHPIACLKVLVWCFKQALKKGNQTLDKI